MVPKFNVLIARCSSSRLNYIDQFRLLRGVALKAQTALLRAQGKTVFDPDFDIDESGLPHEKPAIPAIECPLWVISRHSSVPQSMSALPLKADMFGVRINVC